MAAAFAQETIETGLDISNVRAGMNVALTRYCGLSLVGEVLRAPKTGQTSSSVIVRPEVSLFSRMGVPHVVSVSELTAGHAVMLEQPAPETEAQVIAAHLVEIAARGPVQEEQLF